MTIALPTGSGLIIDENFSAGLPAGWSIDTPWGIPWTIRAPVPGDGRLDNLTGGSGQFAIVDNGWVYNTRTFLRTPVFDLSANNAAVLRFNSANVFDTFESLNVDVSLNGGTNWFNVWNYQGFSIYPMSYTLDLSSAIAGQSSVMLAFRFDSEGWLSGDFWQIDNVQFEVYGGDPQPGDPPGQASGPIPANGATGLGIESNLSWSAGTDATSHDVYFGTNSSLNGGAFKGNQGGTGYDPGTLVNGTTYYWRIDEVNADGTTTGVVWSFATEAAPAPPGVASNPNPADGATGVSTSVIMGWTAGADTDSHDVYFGTSPSPAFQGNQGGTGYNPGTLANSTTYYWRIDEVNADGTTTGTVWSFTTQAAPVQPGIASNPNPADGATGVSTSVNLGWTAGIDTLSHNVYFGTNPSPAFQGAQAGTGFDPGTLAGSTTYYWRIDEVTGAQTTTGTVWDFTTEAVAVPQFHIDSVNAIAERVKGPRYRGVATISVHDESESAVNGVAISGTFSGDWSGVVNGTTNSSGQLVLVTPAVKNGSSWQFCVDTASKAAWDIDVVASASFLCDAPPPPPPPSTTGSVAGVVTDSSNGNPVQGATVSADSGQNDITDVAGGYTLAEVPTGTTLVTVNASGYDPVSQSTPVLDGETSTLNFSLTLSPVGGGTGSIKGTVLNSSGSRLNGVLVQVLGGPSATTNKRGKYTIQNVPEGLQSVTVTYSGYVDFLEMVTITTGSTTTLNITLSP